MSRARQHTMENPVDLGLAGRTAIVGGSTSGLGRACALALAREGARVVVTGRRTDVVEDLAASLPHGLGVPGDLMDPSFAEHLYDCTATAFGEPDVVILNGPGPPPGLAGEVAPEHLRHGVESLLLIHHRLIELTVPGMRARRWGRVIAIGSSGMVTPLPELAVSNAGRAAMAAYLKTLAGEVAGDGVTVNIVVPGRIATARLDELDAARAARAGATREQEAVQSRTAIPAGRYGTPDEFAAVVTFLAGSPASYVTGVVVRCDGGLGPTL